MVAVEEDNFGTVIDPMTNKEVIVRRFTLTNSHNMSVQLLSFGVHIASVRFPNKKGKVEELTLGFDNIDGYVAAQPTYIGATIGRVANRVANGCFTLDGKIIEVSKNVDGKYQIHGGFIGFDRMIWDVLKIMPNGVIFKQINPDGHEGYPGKVICTIMCTLNEANEFQMRIYAKTNKTTCVNVTNHAYFNLAGHGSGKKGLYQHIVKVKGNKIVDTDVNQMPTGALSSVANTVFDLRKPTKLADRMAFFKDKLIDGYDNCYCLNNCHKLKLIARVEHPESQRWLEVFTNQPGVQFFTANNLPDVANGAAPLIGKGGARYEKHGAFCLETQKYPDSMNHINFPTVFLNPGETYSHIVKYKFGK